MAFSTDNPRGNARGDLEILTENVIVALPRGEEELRVTHTTARTGDNKEVAWHSIREFYRADDGSWRPGKKGITIRARELKPIVEALLKEAAGGAPRTRREELPDEIYARRRGRPLAPAPAPAPAPATKGDDSDDIPF